MPTCNDCGHPDTSHNDAGCFHDDGGRPCFCRTSGESIRLPEEYELKSKQPATPTPAPTAKRRFFLCTGECVEYKDLHKYSESHILGELRYLTDEGRRVTALALYEETVRADQVPPLKPQIRIYLVGDARMIKCRYADCDRLQRWEIGKAAFEQLMRRYELAKIKTDLSN